MTTKTILLSNDDQAVLQVFRTLLAKAGFGYVLCAQTAMETIELAQRIRPDLIITDMGKGGQEMNGEQMARTIKSIPDLADVPVLLISGMCETDWDSNLFCEFISLESGLDELIPRVKHWLGQ